MPTTRTLQRSFGGGEISPEMYGRVDDVKYQTGLATCRNFIPKPQGVIENRPGTSFCARAKLSAATRLERLYFHNYSSGVPTSVRTSDMLEAMDSNGDLPADPLNRTEFDLIKFLYPNALMVSADSWADAKPRLIPFTYNTTQTFAIEMGAGYFRFFYDGVMLTLPGTTPTYQSPAAVAVGEIFKLNDTAGATYIDTSNLYPEYLDGFEGRYYMYCVKNPGATATSILVDNSWTTSFAINKFYDTYTHVKTANTPGSTNKASTDFHFIGFYREDENVPVECWNPYTWEELFDVHFVQSGDVVTFVHPNHPPYELRRYGNYHWEFVPVDFTAGVDIPTGVTAVASGHTTAKYNYYYVVTAIGSNEISESEQSASASANGNLLETGGIVTISWTAVTGATRYNIYKLQGGIYGYIGQTSSTSIVDDNILPDLSVTPPYYEAVFGSTGNYPGAVSYYEQRRSFAGTNLEPQKIWFTKAGTQSDMSYSLPVTDDDRISFRVAAREANTIRHIVPLTQLLLLTSSAEWRVTSVNSDAITPTSISVRPQSYIGASNVQPVIINNTLVYCAARGGHIRELGYNWQASGFITGDLSLRAPHLFDNYEITDMAFQKAPLPIVWMTSTSGKLIGLTYVPDQQVGAWHWHDTLNGTFEAVTSVAEGKEDHPYFVVQRAVDGQQRRYIERLESRAFTSQDESWFVDSGAVFDSYNTTAITITSSTGGYTPSDLLIVTAASNIFSGTQDIDDAIVVIDGSGTKQRLRIVSYVSPTVVNCRIDYDLPADLHGATVNEWNFARNSISGLSWLEGVELAILADGAVHPKRTVTDGSITLDRAVEYAIAGIPITADAKTLPAAVEAEALGQGRVKNVNKAWLRVNQSSGIFVGPNEDNLTEYKQRTSEPYGSPPALKSAEISVLTTPQWTDSGSVFIRQADPLPLAIVSLTLELSVGS